MFDPSSVAASAVGAWPVPEEVEPFDGGIGASVLAAPAAVGIEVSSGRLKRSGVNDSPARSRVSASTSGWVSAVARAPARSRTAVVPPSGVVSRWAFTPRRAAWMPTT